MGRTAAAAPDAAIYSVGAVTRLTGLSPHVLRAWERRYGAVEPSRTSGGTRRYTEADVERLRLLQQVVAAGHPISDVARLDEAELRRRIEAAPDRPPPPMEPVLRALDALDAAGAERLLAIQLAALGPPLFATEVALPLLREVGVRWEAGSLCVASEHLASAIVRNLLGASLRTRSAGHRAPPVVFTTLPGERHELGTLTAAVLAADAGGNPTYFGPDLPAPEVALAAESLGAAAVAVGISGAEGTDAARELAALATALPRGVELWVGGAGARDLELPTGAVYVPDLEALERKIALLGMRSAGPST